MTREGPFIERWAAIVARLEAPGRSEAKGCAVLDRAGRRCYLERDHQDRPHLRVTHHIHNGKNEYVGLGWAEWTDEESLVTLPTRACPHEAADRATCSHVECRAWRARIVEWAIGEQP